MSFPFPLTRVTLHPRVEPSRSSLELLPCFSLFPLSSSSSSSSSCSSSSSSFPFFENSIATEFSIVPFVIREFKRSLAQRICRVCFQSHQEEDLSDPDLQDEESGEELPQQPLQGNTHSSTDSASAQAGTPTPLTHLNSLMGAHHPHFLAKLKMEVS